MKRYLIFGALGPLFGGFLLLLATTVMSGFWSRPPSVSEVDQLLVTFARTLQYSYLFGLLPSLMLGAIDDIVMHIKRIGPGLRVVVVALIGFASAELLYGSRGPDSGVLQFILYGLVGFVPGAVSSAIAHRFADPPASAAQPS
jgi:hypothetical protein